MNIVRRYLLGCFFLFRKRVKEGQYSLYLLPSSGFFYYLVSYFKGKLWQVDFGWGCIGLVSGCLCYQITYKVCRNDWQICLGLLNSFGVTKCWRIDLDKILPCNSIYIFLFMKFKRKVSYREDVFFVTFRRNRKYEKWNRVIVLLMAI